MPIYVYSCIHCGSKEDHFRHVNERDDAPAHCGNSMERVIVPAMVHMDIPAYQSPIDGREVRGRRARNEDLKRNGCRPWEGLEAEKQHAQSVKASEEAKDDVYWEKAAHDTLSNMDSAKQRALLHGEP